MPRLDAVEPKLAMLDAQLQSAQAFVQVLSTTAELSLKRMKEIESQIQQLDSFRPDFEVLKMQLSNLCPHVMGICSWI